MLLMDQHGSEVRKKNYEAAAIAMIFYAGLCDSWDCDLFYGQVGGRLQGVKIGWWLLNR